MGKNIKSTSYEGMTNSQLMSCSPSIQMLSTNTDTPYSNLANAIICTAADDYRTAIKTKNRTLRKSIENFFKSEWYTTLTGVNAAVITQGIHKELKH